jgi:hypothetical protein
MEKITSLLRVKYLGMLRNPKKVKIKGRHSIKNVDNLGKCNVDINKAIHDNTNSIFFLWAFI